MIRTVAISGYRSLRELVLPLDRLNVVTGANGSGKSSLYRSLRLLAESSLNTAVASLAREGGLSSTLWAGPESFSREVLRGDHAVQPTAPGKSAALKLGFGADEYSYAMELGFPPPIPPSAFQHDPEIKRECLWHGPLYRCASVLVNRRSSVVFLGAAADDDKGSSPRASTQRTACSVASLTLPARRRCSPCETVRRWRFYDSFRTDAASPIRTPQIGTFTPVLHSDGTDLAAALQTILEVGDAEALHRTVDDAFPGSRLAIEVDSSRFELTLQQHGMLRPLTAAELSDGTLRYLLLVAALLTPRPPGLIVLNEPETSLHPDLFPALARLIDAASHGTQIVVVSHAQSLVAALERTPDCRRLHLEKSFGETHLACATALNKPRWEWPPR